MSAREQCFGDVVNGVAKEVLNPHGQEVVGDHVACGDIPRAVDVVSVGIHQKVECREANPEQARAWCVLLGINSSRYTGLIEYGWN